MERITKISTNGLTVLKHLEGFRAKPYLDGAGVATIGYGSTYYKDGKRVHLADKPISEYDASCLLDDLLVHFERSVDAYTRDDVTQNEFDALVCFAYNCGTHALNKSTLLKFINDYKPEGDIRNQFMRWTKINGIVSVGLKNRRTAEINLYFKGK
jgi:lysozyme